LANEPRRPPPAKSHCEYTFQAIIRILTSSDRRDQIGVNGVVSSVGDGVEKGHRGSKGVGSEKNSGEELSERHDSDESGKVIMSVGV
jgi:hypothetical protein